MSMAMAVPGANVSSTLPDADTTIERPTQLPSDFPPVSRSQYVPGARPVWIVAVSAMVSRFNATNPLSPRENAIALAPLSHQPVCGVPATTRRNPIMLRMEGSRCSQTHWPLVTVSIGAASQRPHRGGSPEALFTAADRSLLEAKRRGRNTVVGAGASGR